VLLGSAFGSTSPVGVRSPTLYVEIHLEAGATLPLPSEHEERAVYVASGTIELGGATHAAGTLVVVRPGGSPGVHAVEAAHLMLLGGAPLDGPRSIWWNFVSSHPERISAAAADWRAGRFPKVPGDEVEFTPAPEGPDFGG
jgi:redox-sensitive bicupin YhaK (pirin superfamily)